MTPDALKARGNDEAERGDFVKAAVGRSCRLNSTIRTRVSKARLVLSTILRKYTPFQVLLVSKTQPAPPYTADTFRLAAERAYMYGRDNRLRATLHEVRRCKRKLHPESKALGFNP